MSLFRLLFSYVNICIFSVELLAQLGAGLSQKQLDLLISSLSALPKSASTNSPSGSADLDDDDQGEFLQNVYLQNS